MNEEMYMFYDPIQKFVGRLTQSSWIDELYEVQERRATDFKGTKLVNSIEKRRLTNSYLWRSVDPLMLKVKDLQCFV